jgi:hypothetical protein
VEFDSPSECFRFSAARSRSPPRPPKRAGTFTERGIRLPGFLLPRTPLRRVPLSPRCAETPRGGRRLPTPRRCRPQGSCPSRRFWLHFTTQRAPREARRRSRRPDALRPCSMPLASLELPFRAFTARGAVPALAGPCFRAGSRSTVAGATCARGSRPLSPPSRPFAAARPKARRTQGPGRRFLAAAEAIRRARRKARRPRPSLSSTSGSPVDGRHARFEALLPPRGPCSRRSHPWPGRDRRVGALLGFVSLFRACSGTTTGSVSHGSERKPGSTPCPIRLQELVPRVVRETRAPIPGSSPRNPPARAVDRPRVPPSGSDP